MLGAPDRSRRCYECLDCLTRLEAPDYLAACPDCGGEVRNLSVARE